MSSTRPKRKAAGNKNYLDSANETFVDPVFVATSPATAKSASRTGSKAVKRKPSPSSGPKIPTPPSHAAGSVDLSLAPKVPYNWQPPWLPRDQFSFRLNTTDGFVNFKTQTMVCPNQPPINWSYQMGSEMQNLQSKLDVAMSKKIDSKSPRTKAELAFQLRKGDFIYMVSEPPGEPYYIGRLMGFKSKAKNVSENTTEDINNCVFQIQWFYRPRDILKHTSDSRLLYASMHSDGCPISSFRGLVNVLHKLDVELYYKPPDAGPQYSSAIEYFSSFPNCFYYDKLFDRYMIKFYDIIKTSSLLPYMDNEASNSKNFILALSKRYEFVFMEATRTKTFMNNFTSKLSKHCNICAEWCPAAESVSCAECEKNFHMLCLDPPLLKKPSRGFSWSCALCTKKHELEHQSKKTLMLSHDNRSTNQDELPNLEEEVSALEPLEEENATKATIMPKYELMAIDYLNKDSHVSVTDRRLREEWSMRYLGLHVRLEDAVDPDDRSPYPRASTSLGARYQASNIPEFEGHPIVYYDSIKDKGINGKKKAANGKKVLKKQTDLQDIKVMPIPEEFENVPPKEFPQWLQERPRGYIERGVDDGSGETCTLMWKSSEKDKAENFKTLNEYIASCGPIAERLGLHPNSPNFVDSILKAYLDCQGNSSQALEIVSTFTRQSLGEPTLSKEEVRKFEAGVRKYGSELYPVFKEVKTQPCSAIVRFYYLWKKTERGRLIWGNFSGRKKKASKKEMIITSSIDDLVDSEDDSAYENEKIILQHKLFKCKHCRSYVSSKWFKVTGGSDKSDDPVVDKDDANTVTALCFRCAKLWRRYAVYWEDPLEVEKRAARGVGGYKKKVESELVDDAERILKYAEDEGSGISYDVERPPIKNSVMAAPPKSEAVNNLPKSTTKLLSNKVSSPQKPKVAIKSKKVASAPKNASVPALVPASNPAPTTASAARLTSRQLSLSNNKQEKEISREPTLKRKFKEIASNLDKESSEEPPAIKKPSKEPPAIKRPSKEPPATKKSRTIPDTKPEKSKATAVSEQKVAPQKRSRKLNDQMSAVTLIFNPAYRARLPEIATVAKIDRKAYPEISQEVVGKILDGFRYRQLTDLKVLAQGWQAPNQSVIDLPFPATERDCCICLEHDTSELSVQEMLICSNCGVNVHGSCAGLVVSGKTKPVKQWLCEVCTNDLGPKFSTNYSCSLCMAKSSNREMAILGSPLEIADYLVPILDSGKWCHLLCGIMCYESIAFRNLTSPGFIHRDVWALTNTKGPAFAIESVTQVLSSNDSEKCGICQVSGGALLKCDLCASGQSKFHVTCGQDMSNYGIGLKLGPQAIKGSLSVHVNGQAGKLEPCLVCPKHEQQDICMSFRSQGKRTPNSENKHLIQLFIEDLAKTSHRPTGPQLQARNYLHKIDKFLNSRARENGHFAQPMPGRKYCMNCKIDSSPKWWKTARAGGDNGFYGAVQCHNCHLEAGSQEKMTSIGKTESLEETESLEKAESLEKPQSHEETGSQKEETELEGDSFYKELHQPLSALRYGVRSPQDRIAPLYDADNQYPPSRDEVMSGEWPAQ